MSLLYKLRLTTFICAAFLAAACQPEEPAEQPAGEPAAAVAAAAGQTAAAPGSAEINHDLVPLPGLDEAVPTLTRKTTVSMDTTAGEVLIEIYPEAAPNAAQRFIDLVESGFFDNTPVSRVVPGFVAQFGINWREPHKAWENNHFDDDPTLFALERGTLAFAKAGADTNSTQVFINYAENNRLAEPQYNFTVFGKVVSGMDVVDSFAQVGDPGGGLDQGRLWNDGDAYLESLNSKPTMIVSARVVE